MARALMGHIGNPSNEILAFEVVRLRRRVAELEAEVSRLRETHTVELDLELHRITEDLAETAEPALA